MIYILITLLLALGVFTASILEDEKRCKKRNKELVGRLRIREIECEGLDNMVYHLKKALAEQKDITRLLEKANEELSQENAELKFAAMIDESFESEGAE